MTKRAPRGVSFLLREYREGQQALSLLIHDSIKDYHIEDIMAK